MTKARSKRWMWSVTVISWCVGILLTEGSTLRNSWAEEANLGPLLIHVVDPISSRMILPDTFPLPGQRTSTITFRACRGEFEPASFVLRSQDIDMTSVTLTATDLRSVNSSAFISSEHVDIKIVKPWFQSYYAWNDIRKKTPKDFRQKLVPELLLNDDALIRVDIGKEQNYVRLELDRGSVYVGVNQKRLAPSEQVFPTMQEFPIKDAKTLQPFDLPRNTSKQVWVTIFVPRDTLSGMYSGDIEIRSNGALHGKAKVNLKVNNFDLAEPKMIHSIYYRAVLDNKKASVGSEYRNSGQMRAEFQNLLNHGVSNPTMYQPLYHEQLREALKLRQDFNMNTGPLYYLGVQTTASFLGIDPTQAEKQLRTLFSRVNGIAEGYGFTSAYIYGMDEAKGGELVGQRRLWSVLHGLGGKVFVAGHTDSFSLVGDLLDAIVFYGQPSYREAEKWHKIGHKIFSYANPQSGPENPFLFRLNYGLVLWANDYDGAMPYAYQHCFGSCWNDIDHAKYRDHNFTYPTADGVIDTLAWEGFREAVDDIRYMEKLKDLLAHARDDNSPPVRQAYAYLNTMKDEVRLRPAQVDKNNPAMRIDLDEIRDKVIMHIDAIVGAP